MARDESNTLESPALIAAPRASRLGRPAGAVTTPEVRTERTLRRFRPPEPPWQPSASPVQDRATSQNIGPGLGRPSASLSKGPKSPAALGPTRMQAAARPAVTAKSLVGGSH